MTALGRTEGIPRVCQVWLPTCPINWLSPMSTISVDPDHSEPGTWLVCRADERFDRHSDVLHVLYQTRNASCEASL